jgi:L-arabinose isomerase
VALDALVARHDLDAVAHYYKGSGNAANEDTMSSIVLGTSLLTARHIPVAGEYEVKNGIAMKIMDCLGADGSFTEYNAMNFNDDLVLMGHDGPGHIAITEGKTKMRLLKIYHGKVRRGLSVEMSVKYGPVTLLSVVEDAASRFKLLAAEGESVPGTILEIGNTNSRYRFPLGARICGGLECKVQRIIARSAWATWPPCCARRRRSYALGSIRCAKGRFQPWIVAGA